MSVEQVKAFMAKVKEDEALGKKLADAQAAYKGDKEGAVAAVIIPVAKEAGFNFTVDDFKEAVAGGYDCTGVGAKAFCGLITW